MEKADRMMRNLMKDLSDAQNRLHELPTGFDEARYQIVFEIGKRLQPVNKRSVEIENEMKRYPEWSQRLRDGENQWALQAERLDEIEKKMKALKFAPEAHAKLEAEYDDAVAEERSAERAALEANASRGRAEGAAQTARENQAEFQRKAETLREMQSRRLYLRTLTEGLEKLRLDLNARVRPDLEEVASDFLKDLTDGRYTRIDLTEQYEPFIVDDGERKAVISGGEEDVTHLCLRLAISRMIAERSGQPLSLLVLDEIFGSLDASRRDNVVILLQRLKAVFEQIILITHIESLHDVVDQCLWVTLDTASRTSRISETREGSLDLPFDPLDGSLADEDVPEAA
jgi:exonuclease SbcC